LYDGTQKLSASYVIEVHLWNIKGKHVDRETADSTKHSLIFYVSVLELNIFMHEIFFNVLYLYRHVTFPILTPVNMMTTVLQL